MSQKKLNVRSWIQFHANCCQTEAWQRRFLVAVVMKTGDLITESRDVLRSAMENSDEQKTELLKSKRELIETQNNLLALRGDNLEAVHETVISEMLTFSEVVKMNFASSSITATKLKQAVKSTINENKRPKNLRSWRGYILQWKEAER